MIIHAHFLSLLDFFLHNVPNIEILGVVCRYYYSCLFGLSWVAVYFLLLQYDLRAINARHFGCKPIYLFLGAVSLLLELLLHHLYRRLSRVTVTWELLIHHRVALHRQILVIILINLLHVGRYPGIMSILYLYGVVRFLDNCFFHFFDILSLNRRVNRSWTFLL